MENYKTMEFVRSTYVEFKLWCDRLDGQRGNDDVHHAERRVWQ